MDDVPDGPTFPREVDEVAKILAEHRGVPFLGAGCSFAHLGFAWNGLLERLLGDAARGLDPLDAASLCVAQQGRDRFIDGLRKHLLVDAFDDEKGSVHLHVMGLAMGVLYTTNQDNLVEKCFEKYGRPLNVVAELSAFGRQRPFVPTLYKYHGDLAVPDSVVFTREDYASRMGNRNNALDVRLRSDCLSKSLVFIGFSFNDPNVRDFFRHLRDVFGGKLPRSFLVQYKPDDDFARSVSTEFGVDVIDTARLYPGVDDHDERLDRFMRDVNETVIGHRLADEAEALFSPSDDAGIRSASVREVDALARSIHELELEPAILAFRKLCDLALIPEQREHVVAEQFAALARRASTPSHYADLKGALFNLALQSAGPCLKAWAACCAAADVSDGESFFGTAAPNPAAMRFGNEALLVHVAAMAFLVIADEWHRTPTKAFYAAVSFWDGTFVHPDDLPPETREMIEAVFDRFYARGKTTFEHPFKRARRLGRRNTFKAPDFSSIVKDMEGMMPVKPRVPRNNG